MITERIAIGLGQGVRRDKRPSELSEEVAKSVLKLLQREVVKTAILSGNSSFRISENYPVSEAASMMKVLVDRGIKQKSIILEERAKETVGNIAYSKLILEARNERVVYIARPPHHGMRVDYIAPMILGPNYEYVPVASRECLVGQDLQNTLEGEKIGIEIVRLLWSEAGILPGEHTKILELLEKTHKAYAHEKVRPLSDFVKSAEAARKIDTLLKEQELLRKGTVKYSPEPSETIQA